MLSGKTVVLGVSGGIAAYKAAALCSKLVQNQADVRVIMTESATRFISELTLQTISRQRVAVDTFKEQDPSVVMHIDLADRADVFVVAPATANVIGKLAHGIADDMLTTTLLATRAPIVIAPAMNVHMYANPAVQHNIQLLKERGVRFIDPGVGQLACGYVGQGRLAEPDDIFEAVAGLLALERTLEGRRVLVTAGATVERIDPVRFLTNDSSGKMGVAVAKAAREMGASVHLIAGRLQVASPEGVTVTSVTSTEEMYQAVMDRMDESDIIVKAAAVADYRPVQISSQKIKKKSDKMTLELEKTPDILQAVGERKTHQLVIGFAAETERVEHYALDKLQRKRCDLLVANDVTAEGAGFGTDTNIVTVFDAEGKMTPLPLMTKQEVARILLRMAAEQLSNRRNETK